MRSSNPALSEDTFEEFSRPAFNPGERGSQVPQAPARVMTLDGTVNKTLILLALCVASAAFTWSLLPTRPDLMGPLAIGGVFGGFIVSLVTIFKKSASPYTAPVYAVLEGFFLGAISAIFNEKYPGIVTQAVALTFGTLGVMLLAYRARLIQATEKMRMGIVSATGAIALVYLVNIVMRMFGNASLSNFLWSSSPLSILVSVVVVVVAAFNFILDFDLIEKGAARRAPAYMEWYGGFSLMVTLVWLYMEFLRLLSKLRR